MSRPDSLAIGRDAEHALGESHEDPVTALAGFQEEQHFLALPETGRSRNHQGHPVDGAAHRHHRGRFPELSLFKSSVTANRVAV